VGRVLGGGDDVPLQSGPLVLMERGRGQDEGAEGTASL
jgi:hypothetical protein